MLCFDYAPNDALPERQREGKGLGREREREREERRDTQGEKTQKETKLQNDTRLLVLEGVLRGGDSHQQGVAPGMLLAVAHEF